MVGTYQDTTSGARKYPPGSILRRRRLATLNALRGTFGSGGQYIIVAEGGMAHAGLDLDRLSVLFVTADEPALRVAAGDDGLDLLVLQFPEPRP